MNISPARRRKCHLRSAQDGATGIEAALVLSIFIGVILTIIEFAQAFFVWNTLQLVVGQASRYVMVQNGIPPGGSCDATCAENALQTMISRWLGASAASICTTPTPGQYCVNAICNPGSCSPTPSTTMTLSARYGFNFIGTYTLGGQITVPIPVPTPD